MVFFAIIPFWNLQDQGNVLGAYLGIMFNHQGDQNGQEYLLNGVLVEIGYIDGIFAIQTWHMICHLYDIFFIFLIIIMVIMMFPVDCTVHKDSKKVSYICEVRMAKYHQDFQFQPKPHLEDIHVKCLLQILAISFNRCMIAQSTITYQMNPVCKHTQCLPFLFVCLFVFIHITLQ